MGTWPLLQGYAYHLGIEAKLSPELDDVFGITNDKESVRPIEDFWRLLAKEKVDRVVREEYCWQPKERLRLSQEEEAMKAQRSAEPTPAECVDVVELAQFAGVYRKGLNYFIAPTGRGRHGQE